MDYQLRCECGQSIMVTESAAGASLACSCGRRVPVPALSELRREAGLSAYPAHPEFVIPVLVATGQLPPTQVCMQCQQDADDVFELSAECERAWVTKPGKLEGIILLFHPVPLLLFQESSEEAMRGRDLIVPVPLRLCPYCRKNALRLWNRYPWMVLKFGLLALGVFALVAGSVWSLVCFAGAILASVVERLADRGAQGVLKGLLRQVPAYEELLEKYPDARILA